MRILFMGTPAFAVPSLEIILEEGHEVVLVVTQEDKPQGRSKKMLPSPVKEKALAYELPLYQPRKIKDPQSVEYLRQQAPDVILVTAYGQILSQEILDIPKYGCINVHGSLLPQYRGAAPIQYALIQGEETTGITTMFMDKGLDTGDMIIKDTLPILEEDTYESLSLRLAQLSRSTLKRTLACIKKGNCPREPQNHQQASYAPPLSRETGHIDWSKTAREIWNLYRGTYPWPGVYGLYGNDVMKIGELEKSEIATSCPGGTILSMGPKDIVVATSQGCIAIKKLQFPGKKMMDVEDFLRGKKLDSNITLK